MKKLFLIVVVLFTIGTLVQSCGASRSGKGGVGCPKGNPNKPFRA